MTTRKGLFIILAVSTIKCETFSQQTPLNRSRDIPGYLGYLPEDSIPSGFVDNLLLYPYGVDAVRHPCDRPCSFNNPLICYYQLYLEEYESYNEQACLPGCQPNRCPGCIHTDGVKTRLLSINRQMPGPPINVCSDDIIIADIINNMTQPSSIHWHGIDQSLTPYMDGMPFITQAEIPPGRIYRYKFVATNHGTNFYHSHSAWQRGQGIYGPLVVRLPLKTNALWFEYDLDLTENNIVISDWGYNLKRTADTYLIHGKGISSSQGKLSGAPGVYYVRPHYRSRFRIIYNGVNNRPVEFSIDQHDLLLIAADGTEIQPIPVGSIVLNSGERFDFVLVANQMIDNYWIKVCNPLNRTLSQVAIVRYEGVEVDYPRRAPDFSQRPGGLQANTLNAGPGTPGSIAVSELRSLYPTPWLNQAFWQKTYLEIGVNVTVLNFEIDKISMIMPKLPMLIEKDRLDDRTFCNTSTLNRQGIDCTQTTCRCTHVIQYELNTFVEIIFFGVTLHPAHLHGYLFYVIGMGVTSKRMTRQLIIEMDNRGELQRNIYSPIVKDTVQVPSNGYAIIRFKASNPGYWFLHCHIELHALLGMSAVLQVGQPNQMLPLPRGYQPYPT